jgi:ribosomal protein S27AE
MRYPSSLKANGALALTCPDCGDYTASNPATLGRHRRFTHGILGRNALKDAKRKKAKCPHCPRAFANEHGLRVHVATMHTTKATPTPPTKEPHLAIERRTKNSHDASPAEIPTPAYAYVVGRVEELCRNYAEQNSLPTREFARGVAEYFRAAQGR